MKLKRVFSDLTTHKVEFADKTHIRYVDYDGNVNTKDLTAMDYVPLAPSTRGNGGIGCVALSLCGKVAMTFDQDNSIYVSNHPLTKSNVRVRFLVFSHDANYLAIAQGKTLTIWNLASRSYIEIKDEHQRLVVSAAFSHDDSLVASASMEGKICINRRTDSGSTLVTTLKVAADCEYKLHFSPIDGNILAYSSYNMQESKVWNICENRLVALRHPSKRAGAFSPNGAYFVYAKALKELVLYNAKSWQYVLTIAINKPFIVRHVTFSPCGTLLAMITGHSTLQIYELIDRSFIASRACALLECGVAPYVCLDIIDILLAEECDNRFLEIAQLLHSEKITIIERVQTFLSQLYTRRQSTSCECRAIM